MAKQLPASPHQTPLSRLDEWVLWHAPPELSTNARLGAVLGLCEQQVRKLRHRTSRPSWATLEKLREVTDGYVMPNHFLNDPPRR